MNYKKYRGVFFFSILKYIEIIVTAITMLIVAKKIGPHEMGLSVPILLYITYSNYLSLGINQVVIKNYSRIKTNGAKYIRNFITINFQYLILVGILNFILSYFIIGIDYFLFTAIISFCVLMKSFFTSYYRVVFLIKVLNKNNLIYSFILIFFTFFFVKTWYDYMLYWSIASLLSLVLYFLDDKKFFSSIIKNITRVPTKNELKFNFSEGVKLSITGIITTFLLTSDRIVLTQNDYSIEVKGIYQLADYISSAVYMVFTTTLFYYYPFLIDKFRIDYTFRTVFFKKIKYLYLLVPILLIVIFILTKIAVIMVFTDYNNLEYYTTASSFIKISIISLSSISMIYIALDKEKDYIKSMLPLLFIFSLVIIVLSFYQVPLLVLPIIFSLFLLTENIKKYIYIQKINYFSNETN